MQATDGKFVRVRSASGTTRSFAMPVARSFLINGHIASSSSTRATPAAEPIAARATAFAALFFQRPLVAEARSSQLQLRHAVRARVGVPVRHLCAARHHASYCSYFSDGSSLVVVACLPAFRSDVMVGFSSASAGVPSFFEIPLCTLLESPSALVVPHCVSRPLIGLSPRNWALKLALGLQQPPLAASRCCRGHPQSRPPS